MTTNRKAKWRTARAAWLAFGLVVLQSRAANAQSSAGGEIGLFPGAGRVRVGAEAEAASFRDVDGRDGAYVSTTGRVEWVPSHVLALRLRLPIYALSLVGEDGIRAGLGDAEMRLRFRLRTREPLLVSAGWSTQLPTGAKFDGLGGGALQVSPFVTAGYRFASTVLFATAADAVTIASAHSTRRADYVDPSTNNEVRWTVGSIHYFSEAVAASVALGGITILEGGTLGRTLLTAGLQAGVQPNEEWRVVVGGQLPIFGEHRFDWKTNLAVIRSF